MARKGLGKGLDSLIPDFYNENFDSNSAQSLEDMLDDKDSSDEIEVSKEETNDVQAPNEKEDSDDVDQQNIFEEIEEEMHNQENSTDSDNDIDNEKEKAQVDTNESDDVVGIQDNKNVQTSQIQVQEHVTEVKEIVDKNPRITLWSSRSSAVFRYLRKTEPEFSISKEASKLIEEAVAKKYPEIWALFDEY